MSYARPLEPLVNSIRQIGQVSPVLCRKTRQGFKLFSGFLRLEAMRKLGKKSVLALTWKSQDLSEEQAFRMAFSENVSARGLNLVEQAMAVAALLKLGLSKKHIANSYFQPAELPASLGVVESLEALNLLEHDSKKFLVEKAISLRCASELARLSPADRSALKAILHLHPTASQFREILEMTDEIGRRDRINIAEVLQSRELKTILKDPKPPAPQKLERFVKALKKSRHPHYARLQARHNRLCRQLAIPAELKIIPADFFEEPKYQLNLALNSQTQAREIFQKLLSAALSPAWKKLFELDDED